MAQVIYKDVQKCSVVGKVSTGPCLDRGNDRHRHQWTTLSSDRLHFHGLLITLPCIRARQKWTLWLAAAGGSAINGEVAIATCTPVSPALPSPTWWRWQLRVPAGVGTGREVSLRMVPGGVGGGQRVDSLERGLDRTPTSLGFKIYCMGQRERQTEREGEELGLKRSPDEGGIKDLGSYPKAGCLCSFGFSHDGVEQSWLGKNRSLSGGSPRHGQARGAVCRGCPVLKGDRTPPPFTWAS